jgi:O-antigen/teichoic acid export membrane protein
VSSFLKDLKIYGLADFIAKVLSLVISPLLTRIISIDQFGSIALLNAIWQPVSLARFGGMDSAYPFFQAEGKYNKDNIISTASFFSVFFVFFTVLLFALFEFCFGNLSSYARVNSGDFYWFVLFLIPSGIVYWLIYILRFLKEPLLYVKVNFIGPIASSIVIIPILYFFIPPDQRLRSYFIVMFIVNSIALIWALLEFSKLGLSPFSTINFSKELSLRMLKYGLALVPAAVIYSLMTVVNRLQVGWYLGPDEVAILQLAIMLSTVGAMFSNWFSLAFDPHLIDWVSNLEIKDYSNKLQEFIGIITILFVSLACFSCIWSFPVMELIYPITYLAGAKLLPILLMGVAFSTLSRVAVATVIIAKKPFYYLPTRVLALLLSVVLGYCLIPRYGLVGAALSNMLAELFILVCWIYLGCNYLGNLKLRWTSSMGICLLGLALSSSMEFIEPYARGQSFFVLTLYTILVLFIFIFFAVKLIGRNRVMGWLRLKFLMVS